MGLEALSIGADTFAFFTRNPRGGAAKPLDLADVGKLCDFLSANKFAKLVAHAPYTLNPCAAKPELRSYAFDVMVDDLLRLSNIPGNLYNFHPGSHVSQGADEGIKLTADFISRVILAEQGIIENKSFSEKTGTKTKLLVETMAGKGSEIGRNFQEVKEILDDANELYLKSSSSVPGAMPFDELVGVCLDTCHVWDGGYDLSDIDSVMKEFDDVVGLGTLCAVHLNDSMNELGAKKDRHEKIGMGKIGFEILSKVINHDALKDLPFILETPNEIDGYKKEIEMLKNAAR